jgi:lipid-A-disaccharide synthase
VTETSRPSRVLIVAAEASSTLYAKRLLQYWRTEESRQVEAFGIGSEDMVSEGFNALGRSEELAVVGIQEVVKHFPLIRRTFFSLLEEVDRDPPDFALLLDYPDFNLRLAKKLKQRGVKIVYYISPQIWAWRTHRVEKMKPLVDKMLVLFPFEKSFYDKHGIDCDFVGHPLLDEISEDLLDAQQIQTERTKFGVLANHKLVGLMPGSRNSELKHHLQTQIEVAKAMHAEKADLRFALLVAPTFGKEVMQQMLPALDFPLILLKDEPFHMIRLCDVILTASGTATLLVGLMAKPMVIMYKMNALSAMIAKRFVTHTKYFGMINLIFDRLVVPELFQEQASIENLKEHLMKYIQNEDHWHSTFEQLKGTRERLGDKGATSRVAKSVKSFWKNGR